MPQIALGGVRPVTATSALAGINNISASGRADRYAPSTAEVTPTGVAFLVARIDTLESRIVALEHARKAEALQAIIAAVPTPPVPRRTLLARILAWYRT